MPIYLKEIATKTILFSDTLKDIDEEEELKKAIAAYQENLIDKFQKAILSGEHYSKDAEKEIAQAVAGYAEFESLINSMYVKISIEEGNQSIAEEKWVIFLDPIKIYKNYYAQLQVLQQQIQSSLAGFLEGKERGDFNISRNRDFKIIDKFNESRSGENKKDTEPFITSDYVAFLCNIQLAYIEESLDNSEPVFGDLSTIIKVNETIESLGVLNVIFSELRDKAGYLLCKIHYRDRHHKEKRFGDTLPTLNPVNSLAYFYNKTKEHYSEKNRNLSRPELKQLKKIAFDSCALTFAQIGDFKLEAFHHLNRFYSKQHEALRDCRKEVEQLLSQLRIFLYDKNIYEQLTDFDKIAFITNERALIKTLLILDFKIERKSQFSNLKKDIKIFIQEKNDSLSGKFTTDFLTEKFEEIKKIAKKEDTICDFYSNILLLDFLDDVISYFKSNPASVIDFDKNEENKLALETKSEKTKKIIKYVIDKYNQTIVTS